MQEVYLESDLQRQDGRSWVHVRKRGNANIRVFAMVSDFNSVGPLGDWGIYPPASVPHWLRIAPEGVNSSTLSGEG